jgi:hypothetical protein
MLEPVAMHDDLGRIADAAIAFASAGEDLSAVIPTEPARGKYVYLCAFGAGDSQSWIALDARAEPVVDRRTLRDAISIAALCELAEENAAGGKLTELREQLASLREREHPEGIEAAEAAAAELEDTIGAGARLASPAYLDEVGAATRRLEESLGELQRSPFAEAMKQASLTIDGLSADIEDHYKLELS